MFLSKKIITIIFSSSTMKIIGQLISTYTQPGGIVNLFVARFRLIIQKVFELLSPSPIHNTCVEKLRIWKLT